MRQIYNRVKTSRGRKKSSTKWLQRQLNDKYVALSKHEGYRSRSAYKLIEIDKKFNLIKPNINALDLGAAPGGWSQVLSEKLNEKAKSIVAVDLLDMDNINGVEFIKGDFYDSIILEKIKLIQPNTDLILSDMSPNTTGHKQTDHLRIIDLCEKVLNFAIDNLNIEGSLVIKIFQGGAQKDLLSNFKANFAKVKHFKPPSSRKESTEMYLIAQGFKK